MDETAAAGKPGAQCGREASKITNARRQVILLQEHGSIKRQGERKVKRDIEKRENNLSGQVECQACWMRVVCSELAKMLGSMN